MKKLLIFFVLLSSIMSFGQVQRPKMNPATLNWLLPFSITKQAYHATDSAVYSSPNGVIYKAPIQVGTAFDTTTYQATNHIWSKSNIFVNDTVGNDYPVLKRNAVPTANGLFYWNNNSKRAVTSNNLTFDGTNLTINSKTLLDPTIDTVSKLLADTGSFTDMVKITGNQGKLGIGIEPANYLLQINKIAGLADSTSAIQLTSGNTGITTSDGLLISTYKDWTSGKQFADINFKEAGRLNFYTNNALRLSIDESGNMAQGTALSTSVFNNISAGNKTGMQIVNATTSLTNPTLYLENNSAGNTEKAILILDVRNSSSYGSSGLTGVVQFRVESNSGVEDMAYIKTTLTNFTAGSENGKMTIQIDSASKVKDRLILDHNGITSYGIQTVNNLSKFEDKRAVVDDGTITIPASCGAGIITVDSANVYTLKTMYVHWDYDGTTYIDATYGKSYILTDTADTDGDICFYDGGSTPVIKNRLGGTRNIKFKVIY